MTYACAPDPKKNIRKFMWLQETTASERRALLAAYAGYGLDGFDFMIYSFIIPTLLSLWSMQ